METLTFILVLYLVVRDFRFVYNKDFLSGKAYGIGLYKKDRLVVEYNWKKEYENF